MAWKFSRSEPDIDPFNAPDPVMPTDEPSFEMDVDDGAERLRRHEEERRLRTWTSAHGRHKGIPSAHLANSRAESHQAQAAELFGETDHAEDSWRARAAEQAKHSARTARSSRAKHDRHAWHQRFAAQATDGAEGARRSAMRRLRTAVALAVFLGILGVFLAPLLSMCSSVLDGVLTTREDVSNIDLEFDIEYDPSIYSQVCDDFEELAITATEDRLSQIAAGEDGYLERVSAAFSSTFEACAGVTAEEAGVDAQEVASWMLAHSSYTLEDSTSYGSATQEGFEITSSVYFDFAMPDVDHVVSDLWLDMQYRDPAIFTGDSVSDEERATAQAAVDALITQDGRAQMDETYTYMHYIGTSTLEGEELELTFDEDAWDDSTRWIFDA